ncbi:hypothetical protein M1567_02510 [Candidatus Marsarchaeota archaeon]|nr:hypothetical protein [Candidatus Marsarchaeota archaeon]
MDALDGKEFGFIKNDKDWENFLKKEKLKDYSKIPVKRAKVSGWVKFAFVFLRIYIVIMLVLIILGFLNII